MKISTILDKIDENQLFIPAFQREYVWKKEDAKQLIDSLIKEYPTGTMLTWETASPPELKGPHKYEERQGAVRILLDGQQRVTTLYLLVRGEVPPYYSASEITNDVRNLHVNAETCELSYYSKLRMENDPRWCNITDVFQKKTRGKDIVRTLEERGVVMNRQLEDQIDDNVRAIELVLDRDFPEQTIPIKASIKEAIDIFYKVNASGVALTDAELALAQISGYWPQARDIFKGKLNALAEQGFVFKLDFIVYVLLGCIHHLGSEMKRLHDLENNETLREVWSELESNTLDYVVNLLRTHAYVDHSDEINSVYALVPIVVFCYRKREEAISEEQIKRMVKWFYYSQIKSRYVSQLPQKLDRDLRVIVEAEKPFEELLNVIAEERRLEILPDDFMGRTVSHPLFGLMRWYFKSRDAICLTTGVGLRRNMGTKYLLERDHIFPSSVLKKYGYARGNRIKYQLAQEMTNRAIMTQVANRRKSDTAAADYLNEARSNFPRALERQCIPVDPELWQIENYELFLTTRRKMLADALNAFLANLTVMEAVAGAATIEEIIADGESDDLEFKSSLRWDYSQGATNKALEQVVCKTVAAFGNSEGGILLIGVDDEGAILGLDNDYTSLDADKDKFELHLRSILESQFGTVFVSGVAVSFPVVEELEICQIEVQPSKEPLIVTTRDKNGQVKECFYLRSGNGTREVSLAEMHKYTSARFGVTPS